MKALIAALALAVAPAALAQISPPDLLQPEDGGWRYVDDVQVWSEVPGAVAYRAQIDTLGGDFSDTVADTVITETTWEVRIWMGFYVWRVAAYDGSAWRDWSDVWTFESRFPVANEPTPAPQRPVAIASVSPNPSGGVVTVRFRVPPGREADLRAYDALGREVALIHRGTTAGIQAVQWDASGLPPGAYLLRLRSGADAAVGRVVLAW